MSQGQQHHPPARQQSAHEGRVVCIALLVPQVAACQISFALSKGDQPAQTPGEGDAQREAWGELRKARSDQADGGIVAANETERTIRQVLDIPGQGAPPVGSYSQGLLHLLKRVVSGQRLEQEGLSLVHQGSPPERRGFLLPRCGDPAPHARALPRPGCHQPLTGELRVRPLDRPRRALPLPGHLTHGREPVPRV